jgi:hypothetical protein
MPNAPALGETAVVGILVLMILKSVFEFVQARKGHSPSSQSAGHNDRFAKLEKQLSEVVGQTRATKEQEKRDALVQDVTANFETAMGCLTTHLDAQNALLTKLTLSVETQNKVLTQLVTDIESIKSKVHDALQEPA